MSVRRRKFRTMVVTALLLSQFVAGCNFSINFGGPPPAAIPPGVSRELNMANVPGYVVEPPDILLVQSEQGLPDLPRLDGERLVRPDGMISLGPYGDVRVAGLTIQQARETIEKHVLGLPGGPKLEQVERMRITVDVFAYNSKKYYVITDGAGFGENVTPLPWTGNETVLTGIANVGGLPAVASKKKVWVARPDGGGGSVLPVDWIAVAQRGSSASNYQLMPGDRIYVMSDSFLAFDGALSKVLAPLERILGFTLLSSYTVKLLQNMGRDEGGGFGGF